MAVQVDTDEFLSVPAAGQEERALLKGSVDVGAGAKMKRQRHR